MSRDKPTLRERVERALRQPGGLLPPAAGESVEAWQARAVQVVVDKHVAHSHDNQRRVGLWWLTPKAYTYLDRFGSNAGDAGVGGGP